MPIVTPNDIDALKAELQAQIEAVRAQAETMAAQRSQTPGDAALQLLAERSAPKDNPNYNEVSPFTYPEGETMRPKPKLLRDTFFCGARQREDMLTPHEIDLFNRFDRTKTSRGGQWRADLRQNGSAQELHVDLPVKTVDDRMALPGLPLILTELLDGQAAADPTRMAERLAELERKLAAVG